MRCEETDRVISKDIILWHVEIRAQGCMVRVLYSLNTEEEPNVNIPWSLVSRESERAASSKTNQLFIFLDTIMSVEQSGEQAYFTLLLAIKKYRISDLKKIKVDD